MQPPQQPQQPMPPQQPWPQQPWPQQPYPQQPYPQQPYAPPPAKDSGGKTIIIVIAVIVIVIVAVIAAVAAAFYLLAAPVINNATQLRVVMTPDSSNWTVTVLTAPNGLLPSTTYLTILNPTGGTSLARTAFSSLNWPVHHVEFDHQNPLSSQIGTGDQLTIDSVRYVTGSVMQISNSGGILLSQNLQ